MQRFKRFLGISLAVAMMISAVGCGNQAKTGG